MIEPTTLLKTSLTTSPDASWYGSTGLTSVAADIKDASKGKLSCYTSAFIATDAVFNCDRITIIGYANENIQSPLSFKKEFMTGLVIRALYQPVKWTRLDDGQFVEYEIADAIWSDLSDKSFWRYLPARQSVSEADALYFHSETDATAYANTHPGDITKYEDGVCYYNLWLRHYNDESADPQQNYPMEYAIVRNNIYRVALTFSGPGDPEPTMREPDTMQSRIFVRKWNQRHETTPMGF